MDEGFVRVDKYIKGYVLQSFEDGICVYQMFVESQSLDDTTYKDNWGRPMAIDDVPELPDIPMRMIQQKE